MLKKILLFSIGIVSVLGDAKSDGLAFLSANGQKGDVVTLESGMQYKILATGEGMFHPTEDSDCSVHYHGTLINGEVFDSSVNRGSPSTFAPNQVIKGWTEALQMMVEGDKWELYIPSDLAYGDRGSGNKIEGGATLIFTVELLEILGDSVPVSNCDVISEERCSDLEKKYIKKKKEDSLEEMKAELERVEKLKAGRLPLKLKTWIMQRMEILSNLISAKSKEEL